MRAVLVTAIFLSLPLTGHADYCVDRSRAALDELGPMTAEGSAAADARSVLERLCRDAQAAATADRPVAATSEPAVRSGEEPESTKLLGVEIKQAPKGAAGYDRARKGP
jgi:hypothetical protein